MELRKSTLIKKSTDDGCFNIRDEVPLGKEYMVDVSTRRVREGFNYWLGKSWKREIVWTPDGGWMPTELLSIEEDNK